MKAPRGMRTFVGVLAVAVAAAIGTALAPAETGSPEKVTPSGVDGVKIGKSKVKLREQGLIGRLKQGCELAGPNTRSARLLLPLKGSVDFTLTKPRKAMNIVIRGGAKARGVGIGGQIADIKAAYPKAKVDHSTEAVFGITLVKIPRVGGGKLAFAVSTTTTKITLIGVPAIPFCD